MHPPISQPIGPPTNRVGAPLDTLPLGGALARGQARHRGFSLVEVLVAMVVMAVGLLGIAALYVEGLRAGRTSLYRATAVTLAADMADRIRANARGGVAYAGVGPGEDRGCVGAGVPCTPDDMAADDWFRWAADLADRLPVGAAADIAVVEAAPRQSYTITIRWPEPGQDEPSSYRLEVQL